MGSRKKKNKTAKRNETAGNGNDITRKTSPTEASSTRDDGTSPHFRTTLDSQSKTAAAAATGLPLSFPQHLTFPRDDFLRDEPPYTSSFQTALKTSYLGLAVDEPSVVVTSFSASSKVKQSDKKRQRRIGTALPLCDTLEAMTDQGFFQTDVTQPFGLGTKCAKTYVTRCLVGDHGTTYKYLGLRMFAYRWDQVNQTNVNTGNDYLEQNKLCRDIGIFKDQVLVPRTKHHLEKLHAQRSQHNNSLAPYNLHRSRPEYNICLINRMDSTAKDYKMEPSLEQDSIAVAWHADSSLEHFSSIAVYQLILPNNKNVVSMKKESNCWSLALRTAPNAEGPSIQADHKPDTNIPQLSFRLPSGSCYYMLDDFNHHHQHAVLCDRPKSTDEKPPPTIRFSATYRLLRPSHTIAEVLDQCQRCCRSFHKKGAKIWRSEQLLLNHIESEWLRQFYIQGKHHYDKLWKNNWDEPLIQLWKYWEQLEERTRLTIELLQYAAQCKCEAGNGSHNFNSNVKTGAVLPKAERKKRDKQRKALAVVQALLDRGVGDDQTALSSLYTPLAEVIQERATLRSQWQKREKDHVFTTMQPQFRPLVFPVKYACVGSNDDEHHDIMATSSMPGSSEELKRIADQLFKYGAAYDSGRAEDLPTECIVNQTAKASRAPESLDETRGPNVSARSSQSLAKPKCKKGKKSKRRRSETSGEINGHEGTAQKKKNKKKRF